MGEQRKKLSDILSESERKRYFASWKDVKAAAEFAPLPKGEYLTHLADVQAHRAKTGTAGYKLTFEVAEGEHAGRKLFYDIWLTEKTLEQAKRDFTKIGITDPETQLDGPIPQGLLAKLTVVVHRGDDGIERNQVKRFVVVGIEPPDAFAPVSINGPTPEPLADHAQATAESTLSEAEDESPTVDAGGNVGPFPFGMNALARNGIAPGPYDRGERR